MKLYPTNDLNGNPRPLFINDDAELADGRIGRVLLDGSTGDWWLEQEVRTADGSGDWTRAFPRSQVRFESCEAALASIGAEIAGPDAI